MTEASGFRWRHLSEHIVSKKTGETFRIVAPEGSVPMLRTHQFDGGEAVSLTGEVWEERDNGLWGMFPTEFDSYDLSGAFVLTCDDTFKVDHVVAVPPTGVDGCVPGLVS